MATSPEKFLEIKVAYSKIEEQGKLLSELMKAFLATYKDDIKTLSYNEISELYKRSTSFEKKLVNGIQYVNSYKAFLDILLGIDELFMVKPVEQKESKEGTLLNSLFANAAKKVNN